MTDPATGASVPDATSRRTSGGRRLEPMEVAVWVEEQAPALRDRWFSEVLARDGRSNEAVNELLRDFTELLVSLIPGCLGPYRTQMDPVWHQATELYGKLGALRGLAAGEIIEEVQLLREAIIRFLYAQPPGGVSHEDARLTLREGLRLSRIVDRGVTHASIGHTDALFFALFHGNGVPRSLDGELLEEVRDQLEELRAERDEIMQLLRG